MARNILPRMVESPHKSSFMPARDTLTEEGLESLLKAVKTRGPCGKRNLVLLTLFLTPASASAKPSPCKPPTSIGTLWQRLFSSPPLAWATSACPCGGRPLSRLQAGCCVSPGCLHKEGGLSPTWVPGKGHKRALVPVTARAVARLDCLARRQR